MSTSDKAQEAVQHLEALGFVWTGEHGWRYRTSSPFEQRHADTPEERQQRIRQELANLRAERSARAWPTNTGAWGA